MRVRAIAIALLLPTLINIIGVANYSLALIHVKIYTHKALQFSLLNSGLTGFQPAEIHVVEGRNYILHRPQSADDFEFRNGVQYYKGKPLQVLAIPKLLEDQPNGDFERIHGKEFRYKGQMYDIVLSQSGIDTTWYTVFADHQEDELFAARDRASRWHEEHRDNSAPAAPVNPQHLVNRLPGPALLPSSTPTEKPPIVWVETLVSGLPVNVEDPVPPVPPPRG